jgi:hypothetical protein
MLKKKNLSQGKWHNETQLFEGKETTKTKQQNIALSGVAVGSALASGSKGWRFEYSSRPMIKMINNYLYYLTWRNL